MESSLVTLIASQTYRPWSSVLAFTICRYPGFVVKFLFLKSSPFLYHIIILGFGNTEHITEAFDPSIIFWVVFVSEKLNELWTCSKKDLFVLQS